MSGEPDHKTYPTGSLYNKKVDYNLTVHLFIDQDSKHTTGGEETLHVLSVGLRLTVKYYI